jgi:hypothetical protein
MRRARPTNRRRITEMAEKTAPKKEAALSIRTRSIARLSTVAIDDYPSIAVEIPIAVATSADDDGVVAIPAVTLANDFAIAITISIMAGSDGHAARTDANTNFFRPSRHCDANSGHSDSSYCKTFDHRMLLSFERSGGQFARR